MADKKTVQSLNWIFGNPPSSVAPFQNKGRSGRVVGVRKAGVTTDHPLTPVAQELAAELLQESLDKDRQTDPRTAFDKKFDIRDGVAHVTPELFREIFISHDILKRLRAKSVGKIMIDNRIDCSAEFEFFKTDSTPSDVEDLHHELDVVGSQQIVELGVFSCLGTRPAILLRRQTKGFHGIIRLLQVPAELIHHSENLMSGKASRRYTPNMNLYHGGNLNKDGNMIQGNTRMIFDSFHSLTKFIETQADNKSGYPLTADIPNNTLDSGDGRVGILYHPDHFQGDTSTMPSVSVRQIGPRLIEKRNMTSSQFLAQIFGEHAGYVLTSYSNRKNDSPIAILVRPEYSSPSISPENI